MDNNSTLNSSIHITQASDALYETGLDDEFVTDDVAEMTQIWINERNSPEVLPYRRRLVEDLTELIEHQVSERKKTSKRSQGKIIQPALVLGHGGYGGTIRKRGYAISVHVVPNRDGAN